MRRHTRVVRCHSFAYSRERSRLTATPQPSVLLQRVFSNFEIVAVSRLPLGAFLFSFYCPQANGWACVDFGRTHPIDELFWILPIYLLGFFSKYEYWVTDLIMPIYHFKFFLVCHLPFCITRFHIYLWRKIGCLFCFVCTYEIHRMRMLQIVFLVSLESSCKEGCRMLQIVFLVSLESSCKEGCIGLGPWHWGLVMQKLLNIEWFLHWK